MFNQVFMTYLGSCMIVISVILISAIHVSTIIHHIYRHRFFIDIYIYRYIDCLCYVVMHSDNLHHVHLMNIYQPHLTVT